MLRGCVTRAFVDMERLKGFFRGCLNRACVKKVISRRHVLIGRLERGCLERMS